MRNKSNGCGSGERDVYLSVDLDYWAKYVKYATPQHCGHFLGQVGKLGRPIVICTDHQSLLQDLDGRTYRRLINVDFHDDIEVEDSLLKSVLPPNPGDWATFVPFRKDAIYEWRFPSRCICVTKRHGLCSDDPNLWSHPSRTGWKKCIRAQGLHHIPWGRVDRVCIVLSPEFTMWEPVLQPLLRLLRQRSRIRRLDSNVNTTISYWLLQSEVRL